MHFEAKKKQLATALANVRSITGALDIEDGSNPPVRLLTAKKRLKIATVYAEATVPDVTVKDDGEAIVDMQSLQQALSVGGDLFKFKLGKSAAQFQCGRSKGPVSLREGGFYDTVLKDAPKASIHLAGLKDLLVNLALKGDAGDRTLHFDPKAGVVRGESSDGYRGVVVTAKAGESEEGFEAVSLSLLQKACDTLGKLVGDSNLGFNDDFLSVQTPGFKAVVPLSADAPLEIQSQLTEWLKGQTYLGSFTIKVKELKDALSDAQSMVGANIQAILDLNLSGSTTNATLSGNSESGEIEVGLTLESTNLKTEFAMQISAPGLQDCLNFYKDDVVKIEVYSEALSLNLLEESDWIESQVTVVPLVAEIVAEVVELPEEPEEEEKPKPKAKKKASKKKATKKKPEPEPEPEEEEPEPAADDDDDDAPIDDDDEDIDDLEGDDDEDFDDEE